MAELSNDGQLPTRLSLMRGPPSASSSYADSEASVETATASFATNSTIGDSVFRDGPPSSLNTPLQAHVPRSSSNTLPSDPSTNTPLPLMQLKDGNTLIFIDPPPSAVSPIYASMRIGQCGAPLRVHSSNLVGDVFKQALGPDIQRRHINRLVKQNKIILNNNGTLPRGIEFVLDLTPEDEGDKAVAWQEKLWCPDVVLQWRSNLEDFANPATRPLPSEDRIAKELEQFRQQQWGEKVAADGEPLASSEVTRSSLPEPYSFGRHVLALERLIHILHGSDPIVESTVDWYTLHKLSVAFGTTDQTRDYIFRWIVSNSLMIETYPFFMLGIAIEANLATIASDAFAAAVMRFFFHQKEDQSDFPGVQEAALSLKNRAEKTLRELLDFEWVDQFLPLDSSTATEQQNSDFAVFRMSLKAYITRRMMLSADLTQVTSEEIPLRALMRTTWVNLGDTVLSCDNSALAPTNLDTIARFDLGRAVTAWRKWEALGEATGSEVDELWRNVKLGAQFGPVPSVMQQTSVDHPQNIEASVDDANSEVVSLSGTEVVSFDDDVKSIKSVSSTHTINQAMRGLHTDVSGEATHRQQFSMGVIEPTDTTPIFGATGKDDTETVNYTQQTISSQSSYTAASASFPMQENINAPSPTDPQSDPDAPLWLREQLAGLSRRSEPAYFWAVMHHPQHDMTRTAEPRIRCLDCPDMLYFPGPDESLENFHVHLRNARHLARLQSRVKDKATPHLYPSSDDEFRASSWTPNGTYVSPFADPPVYLPEHLLIILRQCEAYIKSRCAEMSARNIVFEPILLEDQLACLEESERAFMPVWTSVETTIPSGTRAPNRGVSDQTGDEDMSVNVSTVGVGSTATASTVSTASTASTMGSYVDIETPGASTSSGSIVGVSDEEDGVVYGSGEEEDWVMDDGDDDDDEEFEIDDDHYFQG